MKVKFIRQLIGVILIGAAIVGLSSCASHPAKTESTKLRQHTLIDADWSFHRGDVSSNEDVVSANYDDHAWQRVNLPHDYVLDGSYSSNNVRNHGYLPLEPAWYRKRFFIPESDAGKFLQLQFDGIYRDSQVWLNGQFLGRHPSGYTGFEYDIAKAARLGRDNIIVVRVDPRLEEGHWYEGGGIYRHVYFNAMSPLHVAPRGIYVVAKVPDGDKGADAEADLTIQTTLKNDGPNALDCEVLSEVLGPKGDAVKSLRTPGSVVAGGTNELVQGMLIERPQLWSLEKPQLYELRTTILQNGKALDSTMTTFGVRTIRFDADKGFFLNGKHVKIHGAASHQDLPAVGIAVPDNLQAWRVSKLKEMGCNGWRTAHNCATESLLDVCDRLGMLVMDENRHLGDGVTNHTARGTSYTNLSDLAFMVARDRNHPSVIMWSLCNEEGQWQKSREGARAFSAMMDVVHRYDKTRPCTSAMHGGWTNNGFATVEDVLGINYHPQLYDEIHHFRPHLPIFGSETTNDKTTRGQYADDPTNGWCSSYNLTEQSLKPAEERDYVAGYYTWTAFDYKGEPNPFGWPDISNNTGLMDVCGFPKDRYYYFEACWSDKPIVHIMPARWNWPGREGKPIRVIVFSNAREVELFLNGKSLGRKTMPRLEHLEWEVPYQPGRLTAKATSNGSVVATDFVETVGAPASIKLAPEREWLHADGQDTIVVPVSIVDAQGRVVPDADNRLRFELSGGGKLLGVGNGNPSDHDPDRANERKAFHGHCAVIIQAHAMPETFLLKATATDLNPAEATFRAR